ncbi:hypothetical protein PM082_000746 [Marasmius tenuissimus]|nr:hypothetical protein PM082_000746 [Marasmius tenuissimus]
MNANRDSRYLFPDGGFTDPNDPISSVYCMDDKTSKKAADTRYKGSKAKAAAAKKKKLIVRVMSCFGG